MCHRFDIRNARSVVISSQIQSPAVGYPVNCLQRGIFFCATRAGSLLRRSIDKPAYAPSVAHQRCTRDCCDAAAANNNARLAAMPAAHAKSPSNFMIVARAPIAARKSGAFRSVRLLTELGGRVREARHLAVCRGAVAPAL